MIILLPPTECGINRLCHHCCCSSNNWSDDSKFQEEVRTVVVVVVVDSLEQELEEEYPNGDGVRLRADTGDGDGARSISSLRLSSFAGVSGLFLTDLKEGSLCSSKF
jgi:hypothetical protein